MKNMNRIGLAELISPLTLNDFFNNHWPLQPLFIAPAKNKLESLFQLPQLQGLEKIVESRMLKVRACLPDFDDEYSSIMVEPQDALKAYNNNMTLVFDSMQMQDAFIAKMLKNIREDLGLVTGGAENNLCKARSIAYATPAGGRTSLHFDANVNFVIQISGSKKWRLAPNQSVINPTERFTAGALEMSAALERQFHDYIIEEMPEDCQEILMEPGCVLFVPRGYWHETSTTEDSLSLNFTFSQPTWADIFTKSLQEVLLTSSDWRELADGLEGADLNRKAKAIQRFNELVQQLSQQMPGISGVDLLTQGGFIDQEVE